MTNINPDVSKEDLILLELRNMKENQNKFEDSVNNKFNDIKESYNNLEKSLTKRLDKIEKNDLLHIEKELIKINEDNAVIKSSLDYTNKIMLLILGILVTIVLGAAINYLFHL
jgi:hypothetical protein